MSLSLEVWEGRRIGKIRQGDFCQGVPIYHAGRLGKGWEGIQAVLQPERIREETGRSPCDCF